MQTTSRVHRIITRTSMPMLRVSLAMGTPWEEALGVASFDLIMRMLEDDYDDAAIDEAVAALAAEARYEMTRESVVELGEVA